MSIETKYDINSRGIIVSSGKFEGEMLYVPHYWDIIQVSGQSETLYWADETESYIIELDESDWNTWHDLDGAYALHINEDSQGFVSCETLTKEEYDELIVKNDIDLSDVKEIMKSNQEEMF